jgi:ketosteroid isomerase-like protein
MSQENIAIVRRILDAINRRDVDAAIESASEDFEADWSNSRGLLSGIHRGRDEARESLKAFLEPWESLRWDPEELIELEDDRVLTVSHIRMRGRGSGVEVSATGASIWTIRGGKATAMKLYQSKVAALEAAGLSE